MGNIKHVVLAFGWILTSVTSGCVTTPKAYVGPAKNATENFVPLQPEEWQLPNGMKVLYIRDDELPVVSAKLFLPGGSLWISQEQAGGIAAVGDQMRQGGAGKLTADQLDRELERLSASVSSSFGAEFGSVSFSSLSTDVERVFSLFADVLLRPRFESDRLNLWKGQSAESIRRRKDDPNTVASLSFNELVYRGTPYGRTLRSADVERVTQGTLKQLHGRLVHPDHALLAITGNVSREQVEALISKHLASWPASGQPRPVPPPIPSEPEPAIYFINLPFAQATVHLGQLGIPRLAPDYPAVDVFNEIFGTSGFSSRLMARVRTQLGLSYSVTGGIFAGPVRGTNVVALQTKAETCGQAVLESIKVIERLQGEPVANEELVEKQTSIANSFVFNFESSESTVGREARLRLLDFPSDFDETYLGKIREVTPQAVQEVARKRWTPEKLLIVVVGNETAYNSLQLLLKDPQPVLRGMSIKRIEFDQSVIINSSTGK